MYADLPPRVKGALAICDRGLCRRLGFREYVKRFWPLIDPAPFISSWHIDLLCDELEKFAKGETERLLINVPPGTGKSTLVCALFPAYVWACINPTYKWMCASYDAALVLRDARRSRVLAEAPRHETAFSNVRIIRDRRQSEDAAGIYRTVAGGLRFSSSIGGRGIGWHCHGQIVDDPHKPLDVTAISGVELDKVWSWYGLMSGRGQPGAIFQRLVIMQRLHERDLSGMLIMAGGYRHICLPMRFEADHPYRHPDDPRRPGELLCPGLKNERIVDLETKEMAGAGVDCAAQHQQLPAPPGGAVFSFTDFRAWWYKLPSHCLFAQSWDFTFGERRNSWVVGQLWASDGEYYYLVDQVREQTDYPGMKRMLRDFRARHYYTTTIYVEGAAAGKPIIQELRNEIQGLEEVPAAGTGGKLARARAITGLFSDGKIFFPHPVNATFFERSWPCTWIGDTIERFRRFRGAGADVADEIDCASQVLLRLRDTSIMRLTSLKGLRNAQNI